MNHSDIRGLVTARLGCVGGASVYERTSCLPSAKARSQGASRIPLSFTPALSLSPRPLGFLFLETIRRLSSFNPTRTKFGKASPRPRPQSTTSRDADTPSFLGASFASSSPSRGRRRQRFFQQVFLLGDGPDEAREPRRLSSAACFCRGSSNARSGDADAAALSRRFPGLSAPPALDASRSASSDEPGSGSSKPLPPRSAAHGCCLFA